MINLYNSNNLLLLLILTLIINEYVYTFDVILGHTYNRKTFPNVSLGLDHTHDGHHCHNRLNSSLSKRMSFTSNRRLQKDTISDSENEKIKLGIVLALGGHSNQYYDYGPGGSLNGLLGVWDSWIDYFFSRTSNTTSLIMILDERDFTRQNYTRSKEEYMNKILIDNMGASPIECIYENDHTKHKCSNELQLDQGYRVYYVDIEKHTQNITDKYQQPLIIFVTIYKFPVPEWAVGMDEEHLYIHWRPSRLGRFKTNYGYVKLTNWYSYHMTNLQILDYFDYGGKLDNDVSFVAPFPEPNLPKMLAKLETLMLVTQNSWYFDEPRIAQGIGQCVDNYIGIESLLCYPDEKGKLLIPGGMADPLFLTGNFNATFRAHFLTFWLGLYTAPETKLLAKHWNGWHPRGMWEYRWGDQQWWPRPIALFGEGNLTKEIFHYDMINTDNNKYVVHKLYPRYQTIAQVSYFNFTAGSKREYRDKLYKSKYNMWVY